jgi:hypothetical protein
VNIGNDININSGVDIDENNSTGNDFRNNTHKLIFKGIKPRNWKRTINILYH